MNDKPVIPSSQPELSNAQPETQWVMVFSLHMKQGKEDIKKTFKVNKKRLVIGSALSSDIRIQQNSVSNVHAVVEMDDKGNAVIFDMASETGMYINGKKSVSENLKDGDEVKIGFATLGFKKVAVSDAAKAAPPEMVKSTGSGRTLFYDAKEDFRPLILEDERNVIQIFDYPNAGERCLQVVMYWGATILDVEHILEKDPVTLGETKNATFAVPGLPGEFTLASSGAEGANLQFATGMTGVVRSGSKMISLDDLEQPRFHLKQNDLAKIQYKEFTFFVSYSPVPPHLRRQRVLERDPLYMQIWFTSMGLTLAMLVGIAAMKPEKRPDVEEVPPQIATMIFKPVPPPPPPPKPKVEVQPKPVEKPPEPVKKPPPPPKKIPPVKVQPKPVVKPAPQQPVKVHTAPTPKPQPAVNQVKGAAPNPGGGNAGEGAKAAGDEGKKGAPNKPKARLHQNDSRGNPRLNTPNRSQVQGTGNVEAMFSDLTGSISKSMAAGQAGARAAGENLGGFGNQTTEGNGGLGQMGTGKGGGGSSKNSQGLGNRGYGMGKSGTGLGAIGSGGDLSGSGNGGRPNVEVGNASETIVMGGLDKSVIDEYIKRHMNQLRNCYTKELNSATGRLAGRIATRFVISGSGRVSQAGVTSSSMGNAKVESCVLGVLKRIVFPEPLGGGVVEVDYPFSFTPAVGGN